MAVIVFKRYRWRRNLFMKLASLMNILPGVTAIVGGGGKTTLMHTLAEELCACGRVILTTTTHIFPSSVYPVLTAASTEEVQRALSACPVVCLGTPDANGKLTAPALPFSVLSALADYVLVEADGSKGLPLKAHASYEPVIPSEAEQVILVLGADGFGKPIREVCHRSSLYASLAEEREDALVTPAMAAKIIQKEKIGTRLFINKAETEEQIRAASALVQYLSCPVIAGSLHKEEYVCLR